MASSSTWSWSATRTDARAEVEGSMDAAAALVAQAAAEYSSSLSQDALMNAVPWGEWPRALALLLRLFWGVVPFFLCVFVCVVSGGTFTSLVVDSATPAPGPDALRLNLGGYGGSPSSRRRHAPEVWPYAQCKINRGWL